MSPWVEEVRVQFKLCDSFICSFIHSSKYMYGSLTMCPALKRHSGKTDRALPLSSDGVAREGWLNKYRPS